MPEVTNTRARRRAWSAVRLTALLVPLLAGCLRVQVSMGVSFDDCVSGRIVVAVVPANDKDKRPQSKVPDRLTGKVRVEPYAQDGYLGSQVYFDDLTFGEIAELGGLSAQTQGMFNLQFVRTGDLVTLSGRADLKSVPPQGWTSRSSRSRSRAAARRRPASACRIVPASGSVDVRRLGVNDERADGEPRRPPRLRVGAGASP